MEKRSEGWSWVRVRLDGTVITDEEWARCEWAEVSTPADHARGVKVFVPTFQREPTQPPSPW